MAKIDWTKVEQLFGKGVEDYDIADFHRAIQKLLDESMQQVRAEDELPEAMPQPSVISLLLRNCERDLRTISERNPQLYAKLGGLAEQREDLQHRLALFSEEDWQKLRGLRREISAALHEAVSSATRTRDQALIDRNRHSLKKKGRYIFGESGRRHWRTI